MPKPLRKISAVIFATFAAALILLAAATPGPEQIRTLALGSDRVLLAADGQPLQTLRTDFKKRRLSWYPLQSFPENLKSSVIDAEDRRFRKHPGFDPIGLVRALVADIRGKPVQGASTITMQLSDLIQEDVLLYNRAIRKGSLVHKMRQLARAVGIEMRWTKDEILEAYLNLIHLRGEFQGVPAVAQAYLGKFPLGLDDGESATIAVMIKSPNQGPESLKKEACALFQRTGRADCAPVEQAVAAFFSGTPEMPAGPALAPHLARRLFAEHSSDTIMRSTIDRALQEKVTAILQKNIARLKASNVHDSAAIVIDNQTGAVLAYVGAVEGSESPHVDGVQAYRQAGSSLKPFLYTKAFETKTLTPASILLDDPTAISWNGDVYRPTNYDRQFYGPVSVREALGSSLNVPAVKTVVIIGLRQAYAVLQAIGLTGLKEPDFYGASLALGAVEVRLEDLANAYRMLAQKGEWSPLRFVPGESAPNEKRRVFSEGASYLISSVLSDPNARAIGFGWESPLETPFWSAVKTGTSKDYRDNWCAGFSERYTVAVWAGNFNAEAMIKVSGVSGVGPSWYEIMTYLHAHEPSRAPAMPETVTAMKVRHPWVSAERQEYFLKGTEPASALIEPAPEKRVQFVFPADGSVLVKDPHLDQEKIALFVRFKGEVPEHSVLLLNGGALGEAKSPFRLNELPLGKHLLSIVSAKGEVLNQVRFTIR